MSGKTVYMVVVSTWDDLCNDCNDLDEPIEHAYVHSVFSKESDAERHSKELIEELKGYAPRCTDNIGPVLVKEAVLDPTEDELSSSTFVLLKSAGFEEG